MKKMNKTIALVFTILLLVNCEVEQLGNIQVDTNQVSFDSKDQNKVYAYDENDIPDIISTIEKTSKRSITKLSGKSGEDNIIVDTDNIIGMVDSVGNTTYALKMYVKDAPSNTLYNLLVAQRADGSEQPPTVMEYIYGDDYFTDRANNKRKEGGYKKQIKYYSFSNFVDDANGGGKYAKSPRPCGQLNYDQNESSNNSSSGAGAASSGGRSFGDGQYGNGSSNRYSFVSYYTVNLISHSNGSGGGTAEAGYGCFCSTGFEDIDEAEKRETAYGKNRDCIEGEMMIPINNYDENVFNDLTGKADCVYQKLKWKNGDLFKKTIAKFIDDPKYNLTFQNGNCPRNDEACTDVNDVNNIVITIENTTQNSLGIAAQMLHEGIHAEMHRYVSRYKSGVEPNNRSRLLQLYAYYKGFSETVNNPAYRWLDDAHHVYMIENYVKPIASAIREMDDKKYSLEHYMSFGWDGLRDAGYDTNRLTESQNTINQNLRKVVNGNFNETCK